MPRRAPASTTSSWMASAVLRSQSATTTASGQRSSGAWQRSSKMSPAPLDVSPSSPGAASLRAAAIASSSDS